MSRLDCVLAIQTVMRILRKFPSRASCDGSAGLAETAAADSDSDGDSSEMECDTKNDSRHELLAQTFLSPNILPGRGVAPQQPAAAQSVIGRAVADVNAWEKGMRLVRLECKRDCCCYYLCVAGLCVTCDLCCHDLCNSTELRSLGLPWRRSSLQLSRSMKNNQLDLFVWSTGWHASLGLI